MSDFAPTNVGSHEQSTVCFVSSFLIFPTRNQRDLSPLRGSMCHSEINVTTEVQSCHHTHSNHTSRTSQVIPVPPGTNNLDLVFLHFVTTHPQDHCQDVFICPSYLWPMGGISSKVTKKQDTRRMIPNVCLGAKCP